MSRMSRILSRQLKEIKDTPLSLYDKIFECIDNSKLFDKCTTYYYNVKNFLMNLPFFVWAAWEFRSWNGYSSLEIYCEMLRIHGRTIREHGIHVGSEKDARRCFTAAGLLEKAYLEEYKDKTLEYLWSKTETQIKNNSLLFKHNMNEKIYQRLYIIAQERQQEVEKQRSKVAWEYINKHFYKFTD